MLSLCPSNVYGVASAPGVSSDHVRRLHDWIVNFFVMLVKAVGVPVKGGYDGPCTSTFGKCFHVGAEVAEEDMRALQGIIPRHGHRCPRLRTLTFSLSKRCLRPKISC